MQHIKPGSLIAIEKDKSYYYFLVLSKSVFFGCQWAYAFHKTTKKLDNKNAVLGCSDKGFHALIDFIEERRENKVIKINTKVDISSFINRSNLKARIDTFKGGHLWYIYSPEFRILSKLKKLEPEHYSYPIASGLKCAESTILIDKKWRIEQVVMAEGHGQFPIYS